MNAKYLLLAVFSLFLLSSTVAYAQLGEQAGQPFFNISVGSSGTFNYSILNSGSAPISYTVILPKLNTIPHNATPIVTVTPMNGTLAPNSQQVISIKVSIPASDKPYLKWQGVLSVVETAPAANITSGAGAVIREGVAKLVTIESAPPKGIALVYYLIVALVVIIVAVVAAYAVLSKKKLRASAAQQKVKTAEVKERLKGKTTARARKTARKKPARKSVKRKAAKKSSHKSSKSTKKRKASASRRRTKR